MVPIHTERKKETEPALAPDNKKNLSYLVIKKLGTFPENQNSFIKKILSINSKDPQPDPALGLKKSLTLSQTGLVSGGPNPPENSFSKVNKELVSFTHNGLTLIDVPEICMDPHSHENTPETLIPEISKYSQLRNVNGMILLLNGQDLRINQFLKLILSSFKSFANLRYQTPKEKKFLSKWHQLYLVIQNIPHQFSPTDFCRDLNEYCQSSVLYQNILLMPNPTNQSKTFQLFTLKRPI